MEQYFPDDVADGYLETVRSCWGVVDISRVVRAGQLDGMETPAWRIRLDASNKPPPEQVHTC